MNRPDVELIMLLMALCVLGLCLLWLVQHG
jgi:hypothetical protein